jgi:NADP-dependent 3-hydroxy acid dehydrogenase YdfG
LQETNLSKGIALVWAAAGASTIIITGRREAALQEASEEIKKASSTTKVLVIACDITDQRAVEGLFSNIKAEVEKLDVLICNVGGMKHPGAGLKIGDMKAEDWWGDVVSMTIVDFV